MRIEQMVYLLETAKVASINKASEKLHMTQQSLNTSLKKLEEELEAPLLERTSLGVSLTEQGEIAVGFAAEILEKIAEMKQAISIRGNRDDEKIIKGHLTLSVAPMLNFSLAPLALQQLMSTHPQVRVSLTEKENRDMIQEILHNESGLCLLSVLHLQDREFALIDLKHIFYTQLAEAKLMASVSVNHPLARQKSVTTKTLLKYPLALYQAGDKVPNPVLDWLSARGKPQIQLLTNNNNLYCQCIDSAQAVGFAPKLPLRNAPPPREGVCYLPIRDFPVIKAVCLADQAYYRENQLLIDLFLAQIKLLLKSE